MKKIQVLILFQVLFALSNPILADEPADTLMLIGGKPVLLSEFERIYHKNNGNLKTSEQSNLNDYLSLFINFKLKVLEAETLGMDTLSSFRNELAGYRDQLAKSYLNSNALNETLTIEAFERMQWDVQVSHIFVLCDEMASPADTMKAYTKINAISKRITRGESFGKLARENSEDPTTAVNDGRLGYITAFQLIYPLGYAFETAAYATPVGQCSMPFRSRFGYHIVRVDEKIPARGLVHVAHIMKTFPEGSTAQRIEKAKLDIYALYDSLNRGADFGKLASKNSDDGFSARNGGDLGWFGTGRMVPEFEQQSFSIKTPGAYCQPFQTKFGWHIILLLEKKDIPPFQEAKPEIEKMLSRDERSDVAKQQLLSGIRKDYGYLSYPENLRVFYTLIDSSFFKQGWKSDKTPDLKLPLFRIGNTDYSQQAFWDFLVRYRSVARHPSSITYINKQYKEFESQSILNYAKGRLEEKHIEFRDLMQEYHDGILLFDLTDRMVWTRALNDSAGLQAYYQANSAQFMWGPGVDASIYSCSDAKQVKKARSLAQKRMKTGMSKDNFLHVFCANDTTFSCMNITDGTFEKGDNPIIDKLDWKKGISATAEQESKYIFVVINNLLPVQPKALNECRGLVTAAYQDYLEKAWIQTLKEKYPIQVNTEILSKVK